MKNMLQCAAVVVTAACLGSSAYATGNPDYIPYNYTMTYSRSTGTSLEHDAVQSTGGPAGGGNQGYVSAIIEATPGDPNFDYFDTGDSLQVLGDVTWVWDPDGTAYGPPDFDLVEAFTGGTVNNVSTASWAEAIWDADSMDWYGGFDKIYSANYSDVDTQIFPKTGSQYVDCDFRSSSVWALEPTRNAGSAGFANIQMNNYVGTTIVH